MAAEPARITPEVARQAAHWHMLMLDPGTSPAQRESCARWRAAAPEHERAWQKAQRVQARLGLLPPQLAMGTLNRDRRQVMKQLLVLALVAPAGYAGFRQVSPAGDYSTAIGERRRLTLADGTVLQLNTRTVVDVDFDEHQRLITLRRGEILLDSGHDPQHRPLRVVSEQGVMEALGTRFLVRQRDGRTQVSVFEGAVRVTPTNQRVDAGQQLVFDGKNRSPITPAREQDSQWIRGQLIVEAMPLRDFLGELGRYRNGWLRCQDEVAPLLISGAFQLDNTDAILAALPATLPVRVGYRTRYWVTVTQR